MIPFLTGGLLLPHELKSLIDLADDREAAPKRRTSMVVCADDRSLVQLIGPNIDVAALVESEYRNFEVIDVTPVKAIDGDPNELELEYTVKRNDMSQNWTQSAKTFAGRVIAKKIGERVKLVSIHSSAETEQINSLIKQRLIKELPSSDKIEQKFVFGALSNESRVRFFLSFTELSDSLSSFLKSCDLGVRPDDGLGETMKDELKWMLHKVSELRINGAAVHEVEFMVDSTYHSSILVTRMEAIYSFKHSGATGTYTATFEFPDYSRKKDEAEFQIAIGKLKFEENKPAISSGQISKLAFDLLDRHKDIFLATLQTDV